MKRVLTQIEKLLAVAGVELLLPLDYALAVLRHPDSTPEQRRWACEKALPFCHVRQTPEARRVCVNEELATLSPRVRRIRSQNKH